MFSFSIITPVYNSEQYIEETILSVLTQTGDFFVEYTIVDGGSTDLTLNICEKFIKLSESLDHISIKLISEDDAGMYDALASGLGRIKGDVVGYINASDFYLPGAFKAVQQVFADNPKVSWLTGINSFANDKGVVTSCKMPFKYVREWVSGYVYGGELSHIQQESTFWRRSLNSLLDFQVLSDCKLAGDYYMWSQFSSKYDLDIVQAFVGCFRSHDEQKSSKISEYHEEARELSSFTGISKFNLKLLMHKIGWKILPSRGVGMFNKKIYILK